jgi:hypothetical protein
VQVAEVVQPPRQVVLAALAVEQVEQPRPEPLELELETGVAARLASRPQAAQWLAAPALAWRWMLEAREAPASGPERQS